MQAKCAYDSLHQQRTDNLKMSPNVYVICLGIAVVQLALAALDINKPYSMGAALGAGGVALAYFVASTI